MLVDYDELSLVSDHHTEADLRKGCVPVSWQLSLVPVKPSLPSWKVKVDLVAPEFGIEVKSLLSGNKRKKDWTRQHSKLNNTLINCHRLPKTVKLFSGSFSFTERSKIRKG